MQLESSDALVDALAVMVTQSMAGVVTAPSSASPAVLTPWPQDTGFAMIETGR